LGFELVLRECSENLLPELRRAKRGGNAFGQLFESYSRRRCYIFATSEVG